MSSEQSQSWSEREKEKRWNYFPIDGFIADPFSSLWSQLQSHFLKEASPDHPI